MRYGLLALSLAMLTSGGVAAQSALAISSSAGAIVAAHPHGHAEPGGSYGSLPYSLLRADAAGAAR